MKNNIFRIIFISLLSVMLGIGVYSCNAKKVIGEKLPMPLGFGLTIVLSDSMYPTLKTNDLVIVTKVKEVSVGDVVVYEKDGDLIIHRVIRINGDEIITKGDSPYNGEDPAISIDDIKAKMLFHIPIIGFIFKIIKNPIVFIGLIVLGFFLVEKSYKTEKKNDEEELEKIKKEIESLKDK